MSEDIEKRMKELEYKVGKLGDTFFALFVLSTIYMLYKIFS